MRCGVQEVLDSGIEHSKFLVRYSMFKPAARREPRPPELTPSAEGRALN